MEHTLLIADGDSELCNLYRELLTQRGYQVETTTDGLDCLKRLRLTRPAALVLDREILWGGGDGVLDWIREEHPSHAIPVILTGTAGDRQAPEEFGEPPVVGYLPKPFALNALLESVRSAIAGRARRETGGHHRLPAPAERFIG